VTGESLGFVATSDPPGISVEDRVSGRQYALYTSGESAPTTTETETAGLDVPVSRAVVVRADEVRIPGAYTVHIRDGEGELVQSAGFGDSTTVAPGEHVIELTTPVKTYLKVDAGFDCRVHDSAITFSFDSPGDIIVGARPWRVAPTTEITVDDDPETLLRSLSYFGTALQSHSPERSFPTLRGHPPAIDVGEDPSVPDDGTRPDSGITITAPPTYEAAYAVAPLAYYLAARVRPAEGFSLRTEAAGEVAGIEPGDRRATDETTALASAVERLLTHCFTLDCLVRTVGRYPVELHERQAFEATAAGPLDYERLYELPLARRTAAYLRVPHEPVASVAPRWPIVAFAEVGPEATAALPPLVDRLTLVKPGTRPRYTGEEARTRATSSFVTADVGGCRSTSLVFDERESYVDLPDVDADRVIWVGDDVPLGASAYHPTAIRNRRRQAAASMREPPLRIDVVSNEASMDDEIDRAVDTYDIREDRGLETTVHRRLSTRALRQLIESGTDLLHFVGHATPDGLRCTDGSLDVSSVDRSRVNAFHLNACESFRQGEALVERGSIGGIVTHSRVADHLATEAGVIVARLLNLGYPLGAALRVIDLATNVGGMYTALGDEGVCLVQPTGGCPCLWVVSSDPPGDRYDVGVRPFTADACRWGVGTLVTYRPDSHDRHYLLPRPTDTLEVPGERLRTLHERHGVAMLLDGELRWTFPD
jgi:hypothetical protein